MSMVAWSFLDLHASYSGWTGPRRAVSVAQGREAAEGPDPRDPAEQDHALAPLPAASLARPGAGDARGPSGAGAAAGGSDAAGGQRGA